MSVCFLDSSALVKRYVAETGSVWLKSLADPSSGHTLIIARIAWVEVLSALFRRQREASLSPGDVTRAISALQYDLDTQYQVVELDLHIAQLAGNLVLHHPIRAYDAVQMACALRVHRVISHRSGAALLFVTADTRLAAVAQAEGLATDDPNLHP